MTAGGSQVLGTNSSGSNIHSHYLPETVSATDGFVLSGRMRMTDAKSGVGVTFLSDYPASDTYYRLRRFSGEGGTFRLSPHGTSVSGTTNSGVVPAANMWYEFEIEVSDTGSATEIRARAWESGTLKPLVWQIDAVDASGERVDVRSDRCVGACRRFEVLGRSRRVGCARAGSVDGGCDAVGCGVGVGVAGPDRLRR